MRISTSLRWLVFAVSAAMLLAVAAACTETVEVPGETVFIEKEVIKEVEVPGETVVVEKIVTETVEVPGETVVQEVVKEVQVPGETVVVEKEVVKTVEVPGQTVVVEKEVVKTVEVPGQKYVTDPTTGKTVVAPQYGGTLIAGSGADPAGSDAFFGHPTMKAIEQVAEQLGGTDWAINRNEVDLKGVYLPGSALTGRLAESWESSPDGLSFTFSIRQGVNWHNKAPMNGRELTAKDVEYNWHRYTGLGSGFTEFSPNIAQWSGLDELGFESIVATDKNTVVFTVGKPNLGLPREILWPYPMGILPPEVIEQHGDVSDWRNLVGSGPFELADWVEGSSLTWNKNPDYWGYDEKYPQNRLPYVDELRLMIMPDETTRLAALRTAKIDYMGKLFYTGVKSINSIERLQQTNPEIQIDSYYVDGNGLALSAQKAPFNDIRVRRAIQMALDIDAVSRNYFKGWSLGPPVGYMGNGVVGYVPPFEDWPEDIKQYYTYNPEAAEALLDEAGLPRGADGVRFKSGMDFRDVYDLGHHELVVAYLGEIGVEVEIMPMDSGTWAGRLREHYHDGMTSEAVGFEHSPIGPLAQNTSDSTWNPAAVQDPDFDAMVEAIRGARTQEEAQRLTIEANLYLIENHWHVWLGRAPRFALAQPWITGYNGEVVESGVVFGRVWIDQALKSQMGH